MSDRLPKYVFTNEYVEHLPLLLKLKHKQVHFKKGDILWGAGDVINNVYYFLNGICETYILHENGHKRIIFFHGEGTVFPGFQDTEYKIERSIIVEALTDIEACVFDRKDVYELSLNEKELMKTSFEMYSAYINVLLYDAAHQAYNDIFLKLCNFLYLLHSYDVNISLSQEDISDTLGVGRSHVTKCLTRLKDEGIIEVKRKAITIINSAKLKAYCSEETL